MDELACYIVGTWALIATMGWMWNGYWRQGNAENVGQLLEAYTLLRQSIGRAIGDVDQQWTQRDKYSDVDIVTWIRRQGEHE